MATYLQAKPAGTPTWIDLMAPDAEAARTFYNAVFGWEYDIGSPEYGGYTTARLGDRTTAGIMGPQPEAPPMPAAWSPADEPADFPELVQKPGEQFIKITPHPTQKQWKANNYWVNIARHLHEAYNGVCAYYCQYIPKVTGSKTVEHFKPKSKYPDEAYKWQNYRLVCGTMNGRKGNHEDVIDPFEVGDDWFVVDFNTYMVEPNGGLSRAEKSSVDKTIKRLRLNDDECIEGRIEALQRFAERGEMEYLDFWAPLLAKELRRQNLVNEILARFRTE